MKYLIIILFSIISLVSCGGESGSSNKSGNRNSTEITEDHKYGKWSCVSNGITMTYRINRGNTFSYNDDMSGFTSGSWEGDNDGITFYDKGFPVATASINSSGEMIVKVQGYSFTYHKK